jgi:hypothetical protein
MANTKWVSSDFISCYTFNGKDYYYKGKRALTDTLFVNELIQENKVQFKRVLDFKI